MTCETDKSGRLRARVLIIGAGSRGRRYAEAITNSTDAIIVAVAEPNALKRHAFGQKFIWGDSEPKASQQFEGYQEFVQWQLQSLDSECGRINSVFICVLDDLHKDVVLAIKPFGFHIMCEKPLATTLEDCTAILKAIADPEPDKRRLFAIGHVLRYTPHNMFLRKLLVRKEIGEIMSIEHTEPVGWRHFAHSYVRGNWRKESRTAPSLLTKSCHDMDLLLWMIGSSGETQLNHQPFSITSSGDLQYFRKWSKPNLAGDATNCLSCEAETTCKYSAKRMYIGPGAQSLQAGNISWPVNVVVPEIEDIINKQGMHTANDALTRAISEDYDQNTSQEVIDSRPWYGRCVYESSNDVCDDQLVTISWKELLDLSTGKLMAKPKKASLHMVALTSKVCRRYSMIYGTEGEISANGETIIVRKFRDGSIDTYPITDDMHGHESGDEGLARQFVLAVESILNDGLSVQEAQDKFIGCNVEDIIKSHAMVFAAEQSRVSETVVNWEQFWNKSVLDG